MKARDLMTRDVVAVAPDTPVGEIARRLLNHAISAVPVIDHTGAPIGMVSEGDLTGRDEQDREKRRDWWLALLADGATLSPDFLSSLQPSRKQARDVMSCPVITANEDTNAREIARLLAAYRIKRVPIIRDGRIVGIVSRADLLRAFSEESGEPAAIRESGLLTQAVETLEKHFLHRAPPPTSSGATLTRAAPALGDFSAARFRRLVSDHQHRDSRQREQRSRAALEDRRRQIDALIGEHISDGDWRRLLQRARAAAENGDREFLLLRFPSQLCADGGRAINSDLPDWPASLRGEAAELYLRWERDLRSGGFLLDARVLDYPGGMPGDIGLFLVWGE